MLIPKIKSSVHLTNINMCDDLFNSQAMASKSIIADLNKGDELNGDNYDTCRHKIW